jgi:hypothetical protein
MVNGLFKIRKLSKVQNHDQIVLIVWVKDEQTGLHICAKRICDRLRTFDIIDQKACRSYGEQDSRTLCVQMSYISSPQSEKVVAYRRVLLVRIRMLCPIASWFPCLYVN